MRKQQQEGCLVIFSGGWADLEYWTGLCPDGPVIEAPGADAPMTLTDVERLIGHFAGMFL